MFVIRNIIKVPSRRLISISATCRKNNTDVDELDLDPEYQEISSNFFNLGDSHRCFIIQPYVKWGKDKLRDITPEEQIGEATALVKTLNSWSVQSTIAVPLENLEKNSLFKTGSMSKLKSMVRSNRDITAVFINKGNLKKAQFIALEEEFGVPIFDRYKIVMQILRNHATSKHAKLQVALAELSYMQKNLKNSNFYAKDPETLKMMFQTREQKIKTAIEQLRTQRTILRNKRMKNDCPVVAVVGYTNAGKTSLIKALTGEERLQPKDQLFATLDVTTHEGILPSGLKVLYVDTVGFITDIPTNLIECFVATLEDAVLADVVIHVEDLSSTFFEHKRKHVLATLQNLANSLGTKSLMDKILNVGNKCDISKNTCDDLIEVSAKSSSGIDNLRYVVEKEILKATSRLKVTIKVPSGGDEIRWLYKNATVIEEIPDEQDNQISRASIIITSANFSKFKHHFI